MAYPSLFSPIKLRGMELRNRVLLPAMETKMNLDDCITQQLINYHAAIAKGGCGLNITEVFAVHPSSHGKNFLGLYTHQQMLDAKQLVEAVHQAGGKVCIQLWHGGMVPVNYLPKDVKPMLVNDMSLEEIQEIIHAYGHGAALAVQAGCDCVEFHAAHSYLPHTFLSSAWNQRTDDYNGDLKARARFAMECIEEIRRNIPEDMPLLMRVNSQDDAVENGLTTEDIIQFIQMVIPLGVDAVNITRGNAVTSALKYEVPSIDIPQGYNVENAAKIKRAVSIPVAVVGRINTPELADSIVAHGKADMIAMGRAQIADHDFCNKAKNGQADRIRRCVGCNQGCFDSIMNPDIPHIRCLRNPFVGQEGVEIPPAKQPKKVWIAGGGMAGLEAAIRLKERGHHPVVFEAGGHLGGQFILAGRAPSKREIEAAAQWQGEEAYRVGVEIHLNTPLTPQKIEEEKPDEVIISIGASPLIIPFPGVNLPHVCNSHQVLAGTASPTGRVVIIGGGLVGLEVAEYLSAKGASCTVIEMAPKAGANLGAIRAICVNEHLTQAGVHIIAGAACKEITPEKVLYEKEGNIHSVPCDHVVMAVGAHSRSSQDLQDACTRQSIPFHIIGDAQRASVAFNAVAQGAQVGCSIE